MSPKIRHQNNATNIFYFQAPSLRKILAALLVEAMMSKFIVCPPKK